MTKAEQELEEAKLAGIKAGFIAVEAMARNSGPVPGLDRHDIADAWLKTLKERELPAIVIAGLLACVIVLLAEERRKNQLAE